MNHLLKPIRASNLLRWMLFFNTGKWPGPTFGVKLVLLVYQEEKIKSWGEKKRKTAMWAAPVLSAWVPRNSRRPALPFTSCVILDKLLHHSMLHFPHIKSGDNSIYLTGLWELNELNYDEALEQFWNRVNSYERSTMILSLALDWDPLASGFGRNFPSLTCIGAGLLVFQSVFDNLS